MCSSRDRERFPVRSQAREPSISLHFALSNLRCGAVGWRAVPSAEMLITRNHDKGRASYAAKAQNSAKLNYVTRARFSQQITVFPGSAPRKNYTSQTAVIHLASQRHVFGRPQAARPRCLCFAATGTSRRGARLAISSQPYSPPQSAPYSKSQREVAGLSYSRQNRGQAAVSLPRTTARPQSVAAGARAAGARRRRSARLPPGGVREIRKRADASLRGNPAAVPRSGTQPARAPLRCRAPTRGRRVGEKRPARPGKAGAREAEANRRQLLGDRRKAQGWKTAERGLLKANLGPQAHEQNEGAEREGDKRPGRRSASGRGAAKGEGSAQAERFWQKRRRPGRGGRRRSRACRADAMRQRPLARAGASANAATRRGPPETPLRLAAAKRAARTASRPG